MIAVVDQAGLSLPDREYYLKTDAHAANAARAVLAVETALAEASLDRVKRRDPSRTQHPMPLSQLQALTPVFDWKKYIAATGAPKFQFLNVSVPEYLASLNRM